MTTIHPTLRPTGAARRARLIFLFILMALSAAPAFAQGSGTVPRTPVEDPQKAIEERREEYEASVKRRKEPEHEEDVRGRDEWFYFQRRFPYDMVPAGSRAAAVIETRKMEERLEERRLKGDRMASALAATSWEPIGPTNIGGRIPALAQHPTKPGTIYIGAAAGGVWKSTDNGANWSTTFDKLEALSVGAIAIDYTDPKVIYAGTGENYSHTEDYFGHGIFKSTDEGATWRNMGLTGVGGFSKIFVHRTNHNIVYAACTKSGGGFYRSSDGGATWALTFGGQVWDMSVNPNNCEEIFIATQSAVFYSNDGGAHFTNRSTGLDVSGSSRMSVAVAPTNPNRVYALIARVQGQGDPNIADFYISNNGGQSWQFGKTFGSAFFNEQGFYNNALLVHPDNPDIVLAAGIDVYRSDDGGVNFINTTESYFHFGDPNAVHPDQHVVEFDPQDPTRILLGNDGGLYRTEDAASSWKRVTLNLPITQFYKMDVDQNDVSKVYGGSQDNGSSGSIQSGDRAKEWLSVGGADGFYVVADPLQSGIVYTEIYYGTPIFRVDISAPDVRTPIDLEIEQTTGDRGDWSSPLVMGYSDARLYSGRRFLWRTADGGGNWQQLRPGNNGLISAIGITPNFDDPGKLIVGTNVGDVRYSTDDGATWRLSSGTPGRSVSDLRYDPRASRRVYLTVSGTGTGHVFRSDNDGATFTNISANLPNTPVNTICVDPGDNQHLFVGTDAGVFVSLDGGRLWLPFNQGLPLAPVVDLKVHEATRTLIAATHGRSMFKINIANVEAEPYVIAPAPNATFTAPLGLQVSWSGLTGPVRISISYDGGVTYTTVAEGVSGPDATIDLPMIKSTMARVKVEEMEGEHRTVTSGIFTLTVQANAVESGARGFVAEAIELRRGWIWATVRGSDSLYKLKTPLLGGRLGLVRTGVPGHVIDMAYDSTSDLFYMLTADNDFSAPKLYRMDSSGVGQGEITLPAEITHASGVARTGEGLAIITPGAAGTVYIIDTAGAIVRSAGALQGTTENDRRSLAWDGSGLVQGVNLGDSAAWFPSQLEKIGLGSVARVGQRIPAVLSSDKRLAFFGVAADPGNPSGTLYYATDTAGNFYRFQQVFSGVAEEGVTGKRARGISLGAVAPNPLRSGATVTINARSGRHATLELYRPDGERVARLFDGMIEAGERTLTIDAGALPSGVYYLTVSDDSGERDMAPVVVMK